MGLTLATLLFFALLLGLVVLPLVPGLLEIRNRTDVRPLRVVRAADVDVRHFARSFRDWLRGRLDRELAACAATGIPGGGLLDDGLSYELLPPGGAPKLSGTTKGPAVCRGLVAGSGALRLPPAAMFPHEVYADGEIEGGEWNVYRAVLAEGDLRLGGGSWTLRWAHAGGSLLARPGCRLHGRASAERALRLEVGCHFERLHAPTIAFAAPLALAHPPAAPTPLAESEVKRPLEVAAGRWLVRGDWEVPAGRLVPASLVVTGRLRIGAGARIAGGVKSHRDLILEEGVVVDGGLVSGRHLRVGRGCRIHGPAIAEGDAYLGAGSRIGTTGQPTTLSAGRLLVEGGAVAHGTVWAHDGGEVLPRPVNGHLVDSNGNGNGNGHGNGHGYGNGHANGRGNGHAHAAGSGAGTASAGATGGAA